MKVPGVIQFACIMCVFIFGIAFTDRAIAQIYVSPSGDNSTGDSWATAYTELQTAIGDAASSGEDVWVAAGTYVVASPVSMASNVNVYGGFPASGNPGFGDRDPDSHITTLTARTQFSTSSFARAFLMSRLMVL